MPRAAIQRRVNVPANTLGGRIRQARQEAGLSLAAVARMDFSRAFLNQVELGRSRPSPRTLRLIAERLGRPVEYFLQDEAEQLQSAQVEYVLTEAEMALLKRDPAGTLRILEPQVVAAMPWPQRLRGQLYRGEALVHLTRGGEAMEALAEVTPHFQRVGPPGLYVRALDALGGAYWASHRLEEALSTFDRARQVYEQERVEEPDLLARIYGHVATIHQEAGRHDEAISAYEAGLAATEHLLDLPRRAVIYEGLAGSHHREGSQVAALEYARKAMRIFEQLHQMVEAARLQHNMAEILMSLRRPGEAEQFYRKSIVSARQVNAAEQLPAPLAALAILIAGRGAVEEADGLAKQAEVEARRLDQPGLLGAALRATARVRLAQGDSAGADVAFEGAITAYEQGARYEYLAAAHGEYAACLRDRGELAKAAEHFERAYQVRSSGGRMKGAAKASQAL